ncbi:MAG TPA: class I SAM-dependent methyltransferase [Anaerolineae bacterium]
MNQLTTLSQKPDYGLDTPKELRRNAEYGVAGVILGALLLYVGEGAPAGIFLGGVCLLSGLTLCVIDAMLLRGSRVGKLRVRDEVLNQIPWRGDERVLDIGCGHGLLLIGAAKHLSTGKAIGVDTWVQIDQADNSAAATLRNAELEGVSERVEVRNGDARALPFDTTSVDIVLSSWALHFVLDPAERTQALTEIERVLKPGGRAVIIDVDRVKEYEKFFRSKGWQDVTKTGPNYLFVTPTYTLTVIKPAT